MFLLRRNSGCGYLDDPNTIQKGQDYFMMTPEEAKVVAYLRKHSSASVAEVVRVCLPGTSREWVERILANLDWLGYITVYPGNNGGPAAMQLTDAGLAHFGGRLPSPLR